MAVPGQVPLQLGLNGMNLYYQSKELSLANQKEWWYRKQFSAPKGDSGKLMRLEFGSRLFRDGVVERREAR